MTRIFFLAFLATLFFTQDIGAAVKTSTIDDQTRVEVTVYNQNFGLVKEQREVSLPKGEGELRFMNVASTIQPVSVRAVSLNAPNQFTVLEQNYEYDLINQSKLLDKYVDQTIQLRTWNEFQDRSETVDAKLISNNGSPVYEIDGKIYLNHPGVHILPALPENLIARPTLTWMYRNEAASPHQLEVSYMARNINWNADYVLVIDRADQSGSLNGWVTVDNQSGVDYRDAKLKLVAGEVNRVQDRPGVQAYAVAETQMARSSTQFQQESFFEYHIYDLQRPTTIKDRQTKQISLLEAAGVGLKKKLRLQGQSHYYRGQHTGQVMRENPSVIIEFENTEANRLGMPLPQGIVRLYKEDSAKSLQFIGEDRIQHTPRNETIELTVGEAFDVVAERSQTDFRRVTSRLYETEWKVVLRNQKEGPVTVEVLEPMGGNWKILNSSHSFTKVDAFTIRFDVPLQSEQEVEVTYRVQIGI